MAKADQANNYFKELGKLICVREGLDPDKLLEDWDYTGSGDDRIMVTFHLPVFMTRAEFQALSNQAAEAQG